jgi:DNA replication protein DnaC
MTAQNFITSQNQTTETTTTQKIYDCPDCKDTGFIYNPEKNAWKPCKCVEVARCKRLIEKSGISEAFQEKTVNGYRPKNEQQKAAKKMAADYIRKFEAIKANRNNSIAFLGQAGSGKTHLIIAIANALLKGGIGVIYMQYREALTYLKQLIMDDYIYQREIGKYKDAKVLLIDDIYKGAKNQGRVNESEMRIMFEIINCRYLAKLPVLISGEFDIDSMVDMDEATGSRIAEMCSGRIVVFEGKELNHRMG